MEEKKKLWIIVGKLYLFRHDVGWHIKGKLKLFRSE